MLGFRSLRKEEITTHALPAGFAILLTDEGSLKTSTLDKACDLERCEGSIT
jgi:hypothetical protein